MVELARRSRLFARACRVALTLSAVILFTACSTKSSNPTAPAPVPPADPAGPSTPPAPPPVAPPSVLAGAGDIALCGPDLVNAEATSRLLDAIGGTVFTAGDNTQTAGRPEEFSNCFDPTWGRHKSRIRPSMGNHDYQTGAGTAYYSYFGENAGPAGLGYYSYEVGPWHVVALNSNLPMNAGSAQVNWLRADLESHRTGCTAAYWHHPLFSSSTSGNNSFVRDAWTVLYDHGVDVVMNGHDHLFERFAPQDPSGRLDLARGIRQFTVGTGGCYLYKVVRLQPNSEVQASVHGVLKLTLRDGGYDWEFVAVPGSGFSDAGSGSCH
jgi:acid phosphatase type 7